MNRRTWLKVAVVVAILLLLFVPSIEVSVQCPAEPPEGSAVYGYGGTWPVIKYMFYLFNGERIVIDGVTCNLSHGS